MSSPLKTIFLIYFSIIFQSKCKQYKASKKTRKLCEESMIQCKGKKKQQQKTTEEFKEKCHKISSHWHPMFGNPKRTFDSNLSNLKWNCSSPEATKYVLQISQNNQVWIGSKCDSIWKYLVTVGHRCVRYVSQIFKI